MPREAAGRGDIVSKPLAMRQSRTVAAKAVAVVPETAGERAAQRGAQGGGVIPAKFQARARRDAAAFYLTQLAKGVLAGELTIAVGEQHIRLATSEFVMLKIETKQRKRANHISVKLRWPRRPLIRVAAAGGN